jgi:hypothetical protein
MFLSEMCCKMRGMARPRRTEPITRLTFALPPDEREALEMLAREEDYSVSQLVRRGVRLMLHAERIAITTAEDERALTDERP